MMVDRLFPTASRVSESSFGWGANLTDLEAKSGCQENRRRSVDSCRFRKASSQEVSQ